MHIIELRLVECLASGGTAHVVLKLPHNGAVVTDLIGCKLSSLPNSSHYEFPIRPQQIVTLHFEVTSTLTPQPVKSWDPFVPQNKLSALHAYDPSLIGHPPFGTQ